MVTPEDIKKSQKGKETVPPGAFYHTTPVEELDEIVKKTLPEIGIFENIQRFEKACKDGGTKVIYSATYYKFEEGVPRSVVIKVDKPEGDITNERAREHMNRGYNTQNDLKFLDLIRSPSDHNIVEIIGGRKKPASNGDMITILVEESRHDLVTLEERVQKVDFKPFFEQVFTKIIDAVDYLNNSVGIYHRDLKPSNILCTPRQTEERDHKPNMLVRVTDFANACEVKAVQSKTIPTTGGHLITNPFLFQSLTDKPQQYDHRSEVYAIGANMYSALTKGKYMFDCDGIKGTAFALVGGEKTSLLDEKGKIDEREYRDTIEKNLENIDKRYRKIVRKCMLAPLERPYDCQNPTIDQSLERRIGLAIGKRGYENVSELKEDFERLTEPLNKKLKRAVAKSLLPAALIGLSGLAGFLGYGYFKQKKELGELRLKIDQELMGYVKEQLEPALLEGAEKASKVSPAERQLQIIDNRIWDLRVDAAIPGANIEEIKKKIQECAKAYGQIYCETVERSITNESMNKLMREDLNKARRLDDRIAELSIKREEVEKKTKGYFSEKYGQKEKPYK